MHQIACIYILVPQQKWNNTYVETAHKLGGNITNYCFQDKELMRIRFLSFFKQCSFKLCLNALRLFVCLSTSWVLLHMVGPV